MSDEIPANAAITTPAGSYYVAEPVEDVARQYEQALTEDSEEQTLLKLTYSSPHFSAGRTFYIKAELIGVISPVDEYGMMLTRKALRDTRRDAEQAEREMGERGTGFG